MIEFLNISKIHHSNRTEFRTMVWYYNIIMVYSKWYGVLNYVPINKFLLNIELCAVDSVLNCVPINILENYFQIEIFCSTIILLYNVTS